MRANLDMAGERSFINQQNNQMHYNNKRESFLYLFSETTGIMKIIIPLLLSAVLFAVDSAGQIPKMGLSLWLKADKGVELNNDKVISWKDQSGNNHHASSLSANAPLLIPDQINDLPIIQFNGLDNSIETIPFQTFPEKRGSISIVVKVNGEGKTSGAGYGTLVSTYFNEGVTWQFGVMNELAVYYDGVGTEGFPVATIPQRKWSIITISRNSDTTMNFYRDGDFKLSFLIKNNQPDINPLKIASNGRLEVLNGDIAEIIVYNKTLNTDELNTLHTYLEQKYKIKLKLPEPEKNNWWQYLLLLVPILGIAVLITKHLSQRKLKRKLAELEKQREMDKERQRISREMHDDIGAGLTQITLMSESAKNNFTGNNSKELEDIAETGRKLINSMSEIIWSLNPENKTLGQLTAYLREILHKQLEYSGKTFSIDITDKGEEIVLPREYNRNIFLVTKEIVNNAIKYSQARNIDIIMDLNNDNFYCQIKDDGIGFDIDHIKDGNGLKNIKHRIEELGGKLSILTSSGQGCSFYYTVTLKTTT
jgi:signal transduction histidine kinase